MALILQQYPYLIGSHTIHKILNFLVFFYLKSKNYFYHNIFLLKELRIVFV